MGRQYRKPQQSLIKICCPGAARETTSPRHCPRFWQNSIAWLQSPCFVTSSLPCSSPSGVWWMWAQMSEQSLHFMGTWLIFLFFIDICKNSRGMRSKSAHLISLPYFIQKMAMTWMMLRQVYCKILSQWVSHFSSSLNKLILMLSSSSFVLYSHHQGQQFLRMVEKPRQKVVRQNSMAWRQLLQARLHIPMFW